MRPLEWMRLIRDAKTSTATKAVMLCLGLRMHPDGTGFVSTRQLAEDASACERTVERATQWARESSHLLRTRRGHRLGNGKVVASEWQLLNPTPETVRDESQPDKSPVSTRQEPGLNPTPGTHQEVLYKRSSPSRAKRAPERDVLLRAGAADEEIDDILRKIRTAHPEIRSISGWLTAVAGNGDLATIIAEVLDARKRAAWPAERDAFTASLAGYPPCSHGQPGGNIAKPDGIEAGWVSCVGCRINARRSA